MSGIGARPEETPGERRERVSKLVTFWGDPKNLQVVGGWLTDGNGRMKAACHHKKGNAYGYCGGCAARLDRVLDVVKGMLGEGLIEDALKVLRATSTARRADKR